MENCSLMPIALPQKLADGEGGSYTAWNTTVFPFLASAQVSGGLLVIKPRGFAFPHYADCSKIGYVIQGTNGVAALIFPRTKEEKVVKLEQGVAIVVPSGSVSWWFNAGNDEVKIIFLGETLSATTPGSFTYSFLAGAIGFLKGFSPKTISKAYNLNEEQVNELTGSQKEPLMTKLDEGKSMPTSSHVDSHNFTFNFDKCSPDYHAEKGGSLKILTSEKFHPLKGIQLCGKLLKLESNAMFGPTYYAENSGVCLTYVIKGSGWVQVVGKNGEIVLNNQLQVGQLFVVPKFFVFAIGADDEGIECFSIVTTSRPVLGEIAGRTSIWKFLSPQALEYSLNVSPELNELFMNNITKTTIIIPPN